MTRRIWISLSACACAALLAACQQGEGPAIPPAESPPEMRSDVAEAQGEARQDVAIAKAEGEHRVAMERCEALAGAEQLRCKDQADATLKAAKAAARGEPVDTGSP